MTQVRCPHIPPPAQHLLFKCPLFQIDTAIIAGRVWLLRDEDLLSSFESQTGGEKIRQQERDEGTVEKRREEYKHMV